MAYPCLLQILHVNSHELLTLCEKNRRKPWKNGLRPLNCSAIFMTISYGPALVSFRLGPIRELLV